MFLWFHYFTTQLLDSYSDYACFLIHVPTVKTYDYLLFTEIVPQLLSGCFQDNNNMVQSVLCLYIESPGLLV